MTTPAPPPTSSTEDSLHALQDLVELVRYGVPGCDGASVSLLEGESPSTVKATTEYVRAMDEAQYRRMQGPCVTAMAEAREVTVADYRGDDRWPDVAQEAAEVGVRSSLSLPLAEDGRVLGGLNLYAQEPAAFSESSRAAAEAFARQAVVMLGYLQQLHVERAARAREHEVSAALQRALLPTLPDLPGLSCAARYRTGSRETQVGGDWYDVFALPDGAIGVAIGDVMGHDIAAAAAMGQLRSVLRSYAYEGTSPSVVLDRLDRLVQDFEMAQLATAVYGRLVLDREAAMFLFANAGHLPPLLRTPDGAVTRLERAASPLIGAVPPGASQRRDRAVLLPAGSLLLLYTDGLVETRDRDLDEGIDALGAALAALDAGTAPERACDLLLAEMARSGQDDDVAPLLLRVEGRGSPGQRG